MGENCESIKKCPSSLAHFRDCLFHSFIHSSFWIKCGNCPYLSPLKFGLRKIGFYFLEENSHRLSKPVFEALVLSGWSKMNYTLCSGDQHLFDAYFQGESKFHSICPISEIEWVLSIRIKSKTVPLHPGWKVSPSLAVVTGPVYVKLIISADKRGGLVLATTETWLWSWSVRIVSQNQINVKIYQGWSGIDNQVLPIFTNVI